MTSSLKDESHLLAKYMRNSLLPNPEVMALRAQQQFTREYQNLDPLSVTENFSAMLAKLIRIEFELFSEINQTIIKSWLTFFLSNHYGSEKFPILNDRCQKIENTPFGDARSIMTNVFENLGDFSAILTFSMQQSAKARAGQSFENHLEFLFNKMNLKYQKQVELQPGEVLDFIFPSLERIKTSSQMCMVCEAQTTLKDRFRLSLGKIPPQYSPRKFIFTLSGAGLITSSDVKDITQQKLNEILNKHFSLVVLKEVKDGKFANNPNVFSYEDFIKRWYISSSANWD